MAHVFRSPQANQDLIEIALYLETHAGRNTAERFLNAVEAASSNLAAMPLLGQLVAGMPARFQDVRTWQAPGFRKYIIFYRPLPDGIEVMRVVQGARNIANLFDENTA